MEAHEHVTPVKVIALSLGDCSHWCRDLRSKVGFEPRLDDSRHLDASARVRGFSLNCVDWNWLL
jgi:hypothetical protein